MGQVASSTYARIADLPVEVGGYELERLEQAVSSTFNRVTTVVRLHGGGEVGVGEDVTWSANDQRAFQEADALLALTGSRSLDALSTRLAELDLFVPGPEQPVYRNYRRWAIESAALDLALRQARRSLAEALGRRTQPVRFVVSMSLGEPPSIERVRRWLDLDPALRFKLDTSSSWTDELIAELVETGAVDTIDLKGEYGEAYGEPANPALYERVARAFPDAWIEDPDLRSDDARAALAGAEERITWDAPIHSIADIEALPFRPRMLNVKPSRFGAVRELFDAYDWCDANGVGMYGGGQFELGPGRGQIQYLASLFSADAPNDVAPGDYNKGPEPGLERSPLRPAPAPVGFRWA